MLSGSGKSVLLRHIIKALRGRYPKEPEAIGITASTGLAACQIGGCTLNSWAGIGTGEKDVSDYIRSAHWKNNAAVLTRWRTAKCLVIDEGALFTYSPDPHDHQVGLPQLECWTGAYMTSSAIWPKASENRGGFPSVASN